MAWATANKYCKQYLVLFRICVLTRLRRNNLEHEWCSSRWLLPTCDSDTAIGLLGVSLLFTKQQCSICRMQARPSLRTLSPSNLCHGAADIKSCAEAATTVTAAAWHTPAWTFDKSTGCCYCCCTDDAVARQRQYIEWFAVVVVLSYARTWLNGCL